MNYAIDWVYFQMTVWKHSMQSYEGDQCKLYEDFSSVIWELEEARKPFNNQDILESCRKGFEHEYTDIKDFRHV